MTTNRARSHSSIGAQLELAAEQVLHSFLVHDQHDQINRLAADLQSEASALHGKKCGITPAFDGTATGDATAILGAEHETSLEHRWHHGHALGRPHNLVGNTGVRSGLNLLQDCCGRFQASGGRIVVLIGSGKAKAGQS